jgi:predicted transcriptional regulator
MVPCTLFAPADQDIRYAAELLEQTQLNEIPVVDRQGRLVGLFGEEQVAQKSGRASGWRRQVNDVMTLEVPTVAEDTNFGELMNLFMDDSKSNRVVVVVRHEKPLGLVYRSGLAALSEPLTTDSFAPAQPYSTSSDYLLVPDSWSAQ